MGMLFFTSLIKATLPNNCSPVGLCALMFEEGPTQYTLEILDILDNNDIKATFFFNTEFKTPEIEAIIREVHEKGHEVGFKTSPKRDYFKIDDSDVIDEDLQRQINYLERIIDTNVKFARSPTQNNKVQETVYQFFVDNDIVQTNYTFCPYDSGEDPVESLENNLSTVSSSLDSKIIVLYEPLVEQDDKLEDMISVIKNSGLTFVNMSECLPNYKPGDPISGYSSKSNPANGVESILNSDFITMCTYILM